MKKDYSDMYDLPHHTSKTHKPMSLSERAAQFAPFKSLDGLDEEMAEAAKSFTAETDESIGENEEFWKAVGEIEE